VAEPAGGATPHPRRGHYDLRVVDVAARRAGVVDDDAGHARATQQGVVRRSLAQDAGHAAAAGIGDEVMAVRTLGAHGDEHLTWTGVA
jgi:hypothetical protein